MSETGIYMYDLAGNWCEECGRAKSFRLWPGTLTGCKTCDDMITAHRCTSRPALDALAAGESWTCPDCDSAWTVIEGEEDCPDCCGECGHRVTRRWWQIVTGARYATAPRYKPEPFAPFRIPSFRPPPRMPLSARLPHASCYRTAAGVMVHVKAVCRCKP